MTYGQLVTMRANLDFVNPIEGTNPRFTYAVSRNKTRLDSIIKEIDKMRKPSAKIDEYMVKLDEINKKHAEIDESGTVLYITVMVGNTPQKAYKKINGEGNPSSAYSKEVKKLRDTYAEAITEHEKGIKSYTEMLENEVPEDDFRKFMIDIDIVPAGLHPKAMDGCFPFIKEIEQEEPVEKEKESNLKKT